MLDIKILSQVPTLIPIGWQWSEFYILNVLFKAIISKEVIAVKSNN